MFRIRGEIGNNKGDHPFREWFARIGELRSLLPNATLLAITATASALLRQRLMSKLALPNMCEMVDNPDRDNIMLFVHSFKSALPVHILFDWLIKMLNEQKYMTPRIMIFCRSINDVGKLYIELSCQLSNLHKIITMYRSETLDYIKADIQNDMSTANGNLRVFICTNAAGMGLNFCAVKYIVHYGPAYTTDCLLQQMGRVGRNGSQSYHLLMYSVRQMKGVDNEIKEYINTSECRREILMSFYGGLENSVHKHFCL